MSKDVTFVINWIDPIADAVSITYSTHPDSPVSVLVDKSDPDSWVQTIRDYAPTLPGVVAEVGSELIGKTIPVAVPVNDAPEVDAQAKA